MLCLFLLKFRNKESDKAMTLGGYSMVLWRHNLEIRILIKIILFIRIKSFIMI
jgi:hypothetical protein